MDLKTTTSWGEGGGDYGTSGGHEPLGWLAEYKGVEGEGGGART